MNKNMIHKCKKNHLKIEIEYFLPPQFWTMKVNRSGDIIIDYCPFCGSRLKEFSKEEINKLWESL